MPKIKKDDHYLYKEEAIKMRERRDRTTKEYPSDFIECHKCKCCMPSLRAFRNHLKDEHPKEAKKTIVFQVWKANLSKIPKIKKDSHYWYKEDAIGARDWPNDPCAFFECPTDKRCSPSLRSFRNHLKDEHPKLAKKTIVFQVWDAR